MKDRKGMKDRKHLMTESIESHTCSSVRDLLMDRLGEHAPAKIWCRRC